MEPVLFEWLESPGADAARLAGFVGKNYFFAAA